MKNSYNIDAFLFLLENFVFILNGHVFQFFVGKEKPEKKKKIEIRKENKFTRFPRQGLENKIKTRCVRCLSCT
jgi:hypothetical protein